MDSDEWHIRNALVEYQPRVIVVEYNPEAPPMYINVYGDGTQAGQHAMNYVLNAKGYTPVARTKTNLIAVRNDIVPALEASVTGQEPEGEKKLIKVHALMTTPRYGMTSVMGNVAIVLQSLGIELKQMFGVFWDQCLTRGIEELLSAPAEKRPDIILTIDYDSGFRREDVAKLVCLLHDNPEVDAIVPLQAKRQGQGLLAQSAGPVDMTQPLVPITIGHFGLTVFRASAFGKMPKPWFQGVPDAQGSWGDGHFDPDIWFWKQFTEAGLQVRLATQVMIGHHEEMVAWVGPNLQVCYQHLSDYHANQGRPPMLAPTPESAS